MEQINGTAAMAVCAVLAGAMAPQFARADPLEFIYVQGSTVDEFSVSSPPVVEASATNTALQYTEMEVPFGTMAGAPYDYKSVTLFDFVNFPAPQGFDIGGFGDESVLFAAGPAGDPLYSGSGRDPTILPASTN